MYNNTFNNNLKRSKDTVFSRSRDNNGLFLDISKHKPDRDLLFRLKEELFTRDFDYIYLFDNKDETYEITNLKNVCIYLELLKENFHIFLFCRFHLPEKISLLNLIYKHGADAVNLWCNNFEQKLEIIHYSADLWTNGQVLFDLNMDASLNSIIRRIEVLSALNALPIPVNKGAQTPENLEYIYNYIKQSINKHNISLHYVSLFPIVDDYMQCCISTLNPMQNNFISKNIAVGYSNLKRRLKVKTIEDSFDSASL